MRLERSLTLFYLAMGFLFQVLYHGVPWPLRLATWLHVLGWPVFVVLGLARWLFLPFAVLSILGLLAVVAFRPRMQKP